MRETLRAADHRILPSLERLKWTAAPEVFGCSNGQGSKLYAGALGMRLPWSRADYARLVGMVTCCFVKYL